MKIKKAYWDFRGKLALERKERQLTHALNKGEDIYIVHTPGRSGTMSLYNTITNTELKNIFQTHHLNPRTITERTTAYQEAHGKNLPWHMKTSHQLKKYIIDKKYHGNITILTSIREPLGRELSAFFMDIEKFHIPNFYKKYFSGLMSIEEITDIFLRERKYLGDRDNWINIELNEVFDVDIYETPFDFESKYLKVGNKNIEIYLFRLEDTSDILEEVIVDATGIKPRKIEQSNISEKDILKKKVYSEVIPKMIFPRKMIENLYDTKFCRHFYTKQEIEDFKRKITLK